MPAVDWRLVDQTADKYGLPRPLFRKLVRQESGGNPRAVSPAGAQGLTQLMPATARGLGVTDPFNPQQNLEGGARYLSDQYKRFGRWDLALSAYNSGPGGAEASGRVEAFPETQNYVRAITGGMKFPAVRTPSAAAAPAPVAPEANSGLLESIFRQGQEIVGIDPVRLPKRAVVNETADKYGIPRAVLLREARRDARPVVPSYSSTKLGKVIGTPGAGTHTLGNWQSDNAYDVAVPEGTPIRADFDGVVGQNIGPLGKEGSRFAGSRVQIDGRGNSAWYGHLSRYVVKPGQRVKKGQIIGYSGSANGVPHLHVGYRVLPKGR